MKRATFVFALVALFALSVIPALAGSGCCGDAAKKPVADVCPVSGKAIADTAKAPAKSEYKGKTYYFCSTACKTKFDKEPAKYATSQAKAVSAVCPVTGKKIADVSKAAGKSTYSGKTYYFCCPECKPKFDKDPQKYIKKMEAKPASAVCPVMGSKIADVSKAAGKSVYKGKTYYFCCKGCKPKFDANPEKYLQKK